MNYKDFIENALSEAYENAPFSDDETLFNIVKERTSNMEKKKLRSKKPAVIAVSIAAAAALTVSAGAALNWDIASLFQNNNAVEREKREQIVDEIDREYNVVKNTDAVIDSADSAREYELLSKISHNVDMTVTYDNYLIHISGYSCDGSHVEVLYDLTYKNGFDEIKRKIEQDDHSDFNPFDLWLSDENSDALTTGANGGPTIDYNDFGDNIPFSCIFNLRKPVTSEKAVLSFFDVRKNTDASPYDIKDAVVSFEIDLTVPGMKSLDIDTNINETLNRGKSVNISKINVSTFGVTAYCVIDDNYIDIFTELGQMPIYITYNNGTTVDVSGYGSGSGGNAIPRDDGAFEFIVDISSGGTVIDVDNIKAVQIYDEIIEL